MKNYSNWFIFITLGSHFLKVYLLQKFTDIYIQTHKFILILNKKILMFLKIDFCCVYACMVSVLPLPNRTMIWNKESLAQIVPSISLQWTHSNNIICFFYPFFYLQINAIHTAFRKFSFSIQTDNFLKFSAKISWAFPFLIICISQLYTIDLNSFLNPDQYYWRFLDIHTFQISCVVSMQYWPSQIQVIRCETFRMQGTHLEQEYSNINAVLLDYPKTLSSSH